MAIRSFRHKGLENFYKTGSKAGIQAAHAARLQRLLTVLNRASEPRQLNMPGLGFHSLKGGLAGHYSLWVNGNWRITFTFEGADAVLVNYLDYH